jgi:hypothetical protein
MVTLDGKGQWLRIDCAAPMRLLIEILEVVDRHLPGAIVTGDTDGWLAFDWPTATPPEPPVAKVMRGGVWSIAPDDLAPTFAAENIPADIPAPPDVAPRDLLEGVDLSDIEVPATAADLAFQSIKASLEKAVPYRKVAPSRARKTSADYSHKCLCGKRCASHGYLGQHIKRSNSGVHGFPPGSPAQDLVSLRQEASAGNAAGADAETAPRAPAVVLPPTPVDDSYLSDRLTPPTPLRPALATVIEAVNASAVIVKPYLCGCGERFASHRDYRSHIDPMHRQSASRFHRLEEHPPDGMLGSRIVTKGVFGNQGGEE